MSTPIDRLALYDALPPEERAALDAALADRPALAEAFARWRSLRADVRAELSRDLPDRALLVLYALADDDLLSDAERAHLDASRADLDAALAKHPGLAAAVRRIQADRAAFERAWAEAAAPPVAAPPAAAPPRPARAADRPRAAAPTRGAQTAGAGRWVWRSLALAAVVGFVALLTSVALRDAGWETITASEAQTLAFADGSTVELARGARIMVPEGGGGGRPRGAAARGAGPVPRRPQRGRAVRGDDAERRGHGFGHDVLRGGDRRPHAGRARERGGDARAARDAGRGGPPGARRAGRGAGPSTRPRRRSPADLGTALAWTGTAARDTPAAVVAERLGWRFGVPVTVDPALADERVNGEFGGDGLEDAVRLLAASLDARAVPDGDGFRIAAE